MRLPPHRPVVRRPRLAAVVCGTLGASLVGSLAPAPASAQSAAGGALAPVERAVARAVDARAGASLALLRQLVDINSGTLNTPGVRRVGDVLRAQLDSLGFATRWVDGAAFNRAGHLVAERRGTGPKLLLIGHLDTVFEPSSPFQRYEQLDDSTARGPASST
jgi:glutamate carboxypeptidase